MKIVFDTNVLLNAVLNRPGRAEALKLMLAVAEEQITGIVSASSITDFYYLARKGIGDKAAREAVVCAMALNTPMADYEDAVLAVCAARDEADYIATCDQGFLRAESPVPAKSPEELLAMMEQI